ncbi:hypothetical protein [Bacillus cereus]|uniref:hypothetical protein n=1 Tax=Bacillus cereus TaxID=1396 RepID=UPI000BEDA9F8|nr:hypothetical protein [Bacillus cereus]PEF60541.1 hypothetical protein CON35_30360 [Bacillus cereus]
MTNNIEKMLYIENREKKRIGSNIFSRVSTRKGGANHALRTPYLYMSRKERKTLNGEVTIYNMNDFISYEDFKTKKLEEQKRLMSHWRANYKASEIKDALGIKDYAFYKILDHLGLEKNQFRNSRDIVSLSDKEIQLYKKEYIDFEMYKHLSREDQYVLFESYYAKIPVVSELARQWEGSDAGYLYNIKTKYMQHLKEKKKSKKQTKNLTQKPTSGAIDKSFKEQLESVDNAVTEETPALFSKKLNQPHTKDENMTVDEQLTMEEIAVTVMDEVAKEEKNDHSYSDQNKLSFELKGNYSTNAILKCLQFTLETLEQEEGIIDIEVKVRKK